MNKPSPSAPSVPARRAKASDRLLNFNDKGLSAWSYGGMFITAACLLLLLAALLRPLRHGAYAAHIALVLCYLFWRHGWEGGQPFSPGALSVFLPAHLISINLVTFAAYYLDKRAAKRKARRIPERNLHALALLGGTPGAFAASRLFRHKTRKASFRLRFWLIVALQVALMVFLRQMA